MSLFSSFSGILIHRRCGLCLTGCGRCLYYWKTWTRYRSNTIRDGTRISTDGLLQSGLPAMRKMSLHLSAKMRLSISRTQCAQQNGEDRREPENGELFSLCNHFWTKLPGPLSPKSADSSWQMLLVFEKGTWSSAEVPYSKCNAWQRCTVCYILIIMQNNVIVVFVCISK